MVVPFLEAGADASRSRTGVIIMACAKLLWPWLSWPVRLSSPSVVYYFITHQIQGYEKISKTLFELRELVLLNCT